MNFHHTQKWKEIFSVGEVLSAHRMKYVYSCSEALLSFTTANSM